MGTKSDNGALTETWGDPATAGLHLYVGVDIGRFHHLVAAIPEGRMENGTWDRAVARRFPTNATGFADLVSWLTGFGVPVSNIRVGNAVQPCPSGQGRR